MLHLYMKSLQKDSYYITTTFPTTITITTITFPKFTTGINTCILY
jgi:hypothetical protein